MPEPKVKWSELKTWVFGAVGSLIIFPALFFSRDKIISVFANSDEVPTIKQAVLELHESNAEMKGMLEKEDHRADLQDKEIESQKKLTAVQLEALKEIVVQLKK